MDYLCTCIGFPTALASDCDRHCTVDQKLEYQDRAGIDSVVHYIHCGPASYRSVVASYSKVAQSPDDHEAESGSRPDMFGRR